MISKIQKRNDKSPCLKIGNSEEKVIILCFGDSQGLGEGIVVYSENELCPVGTTFNSFSENQNPIFSTNLKNFNGELVIKN